MFITTACTEGFYGEACSSTCGNCLNNDTCYGNTGKCAKGCDAGWKGDVCKTGEVHMIILNLQRFEEVFLKI